MPPSPNVGKKRFQPYQVLRGEEILFSRMETSLREKKGDTTTDLLFSREKGENGFPPTEPRARKAAALSLFDGKGEGGKRSHPPSRGKGSKKGKKGLAPTPSKW